ncbi:MAG: hypothetical protein GXY77_19535 [Fibrobacter sp.]|nr:hypothetical protein [Fibrobacter sp.]
MNIAWDKIPTWGGLFEDAVNCWVYAITPAFVQKYWNVNANGYVSLVACHSGQMCAASMRSSIIAAGASVISGWTESVDGNFAQRSTFFFFDRMLGANWYNDYKCNPPQRPFPRGAVLTAMQENDLTIDPYKGAQFMFFTGNSSNTFGMFTPTIERLEIDDENNLLTIKVAFGTDRTDVVVNIQGQKRTIRSFSQMEITAELEPGDYGDVQVLVNNHPSNIVQLTQWPIQITWTVTYRGSAYQEMKITAYLRGDIHEARSKPEESPEAEPVDLLLSSASTITHRAWGSYVEDDETVTYSGSGTIPTAYDGTYGNNSASVWAHYDPEIPGKLAWYLFAMSREASIATSSSGGTQPFAITITPIEELVNLNDIATDIDVVKFGTFRVKDDLQMDEDYVIQSGSIGPISLDDEVTATLKWDAYPPLAPPKKDAQR